MKSLETMARWELASLTEPERAVIMAVELMKEGLSETVEEPVFETIPEQPRLTQTPRLALMNDDTPMAVFETAEDADAFRKIKFIGVSHDWQDSRYAYYIDEGNDPKSLLGEYRFYVKAELTRKRTEVKLYEEATARNRRRSEEYAKAKEKVDKVRRKVYDAISDAECEASNARRVIAKFSEFVTLSNGAPAIALNFLLKSHDAQEVKDACVFALSNPANDGKVIEAATLLSNLVNAPQEAA